MRINTVLLGRGKRVINVNRERDGSNLISMCDDSLTGRSSKIRGYGLTCSLRMKNSLLVPKIMYLPAY
jgi:hypothetical protein